VSVNTCIDWHTAFASRLASTGDSITRIISHAQTFFLLFDLDAGPVTITLPDAGQRHMSMQVINEDHYVTSVVYGQGHYTLSRDQPRTEILNGNWTFPVAQPAN
ncbi:hypothetical protein HNQ83_30320, partial [Pseudomonas sp. C2B4]|nr:hypothetical protein [Pseudomonas sp. C2B4]